MLCRRFQWIGIGCCWVLALSAACRAAEIGPQAVPAEATSVPQTLLSLFHTPEVQAELALPPGFPERFRSRMQEIDGPWWRARNGTFLEQRSVTARQEQLLIDELLQQLLPSSVQRLRQIELQSQGPRVVAREDVRAILQLSSAQQEKIAALFQQTDSLIDSLQGTGGQANESALAKYKQHRQQEPHEIQKILNPRQEKMLAELLGKTIDLSHLERVYPLAPELIDSGEWTTDKRASLSGLRGQVVLLHFYAFQCHNCVANFEHYKRWDKELTPRGVAVIGIQTPETRNERDPKLVRASATKEGLAFPVLIDVENRNWDAWGNTMWPTVYVVDKQGYLRMWWQGELNWQGATGDRTIETLVEKLLRE